MNSDRYQVLVVDDEESILRLFKKELSTAARTIHPAMTARHARDLIGRIHFDLVILDIRLPDADGLQLLNEFKDRIPDVEVIMITGHGNIDSAVTAMRMGAYDYITKPFHLDRIELTLERAWQRVCLRREHRGLKLAQTSGQGHILVGNSPVLAEVRYLIERVAPTDTPVLITGESGAGKDVVAQSIHTLSQRSSKPFIIKNCATLQKELARSELFGHCRGAFTGASEAREGLMTYAHTGTLFLDEIGELPLEVQGSLLRFIETKSYRRVGEKDERLSDVRFLFATNRNLAVEVEQGRFHEALYHRINVFRIELPPLRERRDDIPMLAEHFLVNLAGGRARSISQAAMECLTAYDWPGNVRELRNVIERGTILAENGQIDRASLPREIVEKAGRREACNGQLPGLSPDMSLDEVEREHIARTLLHHDGNRERTAKALGISRKTLYRKLQGYGLEQDGSS